MLKDRLVSARKSAGLTQADVARMLEVKRQTYGAYERGISSPDINTLSRISKILGVPAYYLLGDAPDADLQNRGVRIPVLGRVQAGVPIEAIEEVQGWEEIPADMARTGEFFALKVQGDSMEPRICEGDVLIVRRQSTAESGSIVIALTGDGDATVKKIKYTENGIMLIPLNTAYEPLFFPADAGSTPVSVLGVVAESRRRF
ncbi:MAG: helix-turn-helix domain-containing protein [Clostridia bacterium]|nr:helix-turn-helix domain-containing protein [Clostridia bacterium]